jgi:hypothetical protein
VSFGTRLIEIIAVVVLGITTMGTAWCSYEAYRWNGKQSDLAREATKEQLDASRLFGLATQEISYDTTLIAQYAVAYRAGDERLMTFYRTSLMRPGLVPFLDGWVAEIKAGKAPTNLLSDPTYMGQVLADYNAASARAAALEAESNEAGIVANKYLVSTILLAVGLFFAGVTSSFRWQFARIATLALALIALGVCASRLVDLPIQL